MSVPRLLGLAGGIAIALVLFEWSSIETPIRRPPGPTSGEREDERGGFAGDTVTGIRLEAFDGRLQRIDQKVSLLEATLDELRGEFLLLRETLAFPVEAGRGTVGTVSDGRTDEAVTEATALSFKERVAQAIEQLELEREAVRRSDRLRRAMRGYVERLGLNVGQQVLLQGVLTEYFQRCDDARADREVTDPSTYDAACDAARAERNRRMEEFLDSRQRALFSLERDAE